MSTPTFSIDRLADLHPRLFHMAAGDSWPRIAQHGLLTTKHLVGTSDLSEEDKTALLTRHRPHSTVIDHPIYGAVTIRDQKPLRLQFLTPVLQGMTLEQWLDILNDRVFFWLDPSKLRGLLSARAYNRHPQDVLTIDTNSLVRTYEAQVRLSPINSGSALYPNAVVRGSKTFSTVKNYPYDQRRRGRSPANSLIELAVVGGVPDLSKYVIGVDRYIGPEFQYSILGNSHPV